MANLLAPTSAAGIGKTLGLSQGGAPVSPLGYKMSSPGGGGVSTPNTTNANDDAEYKSIMAEISRLNAQIASQPKLPNFDILGNWNQARSSAEAAVNPLYTKKLNDFLSRNSQLEQNKRTETGMQTAQTESELRNTLGESEVTRGRTSEDTQAAIDKILETADRFQSSEGESFQNDRTQLAGNIAAGGLALSGIGRQQIEDQGRLRNMSSQEQVEEFENQKQAKELFKTRTFEDLARGDDRAQQVAGEKKQGIQFDLDSYLQELAYNEGQFRTQNELDRVADIAQQEISYARSGVNQFLAGLAGQGFRGQDIALAKQVYGI